MVDTATDNSPHYTEVLQVVSLSSSVCKWLSSDLLGRETPGEADRELVADTCPILRWHRPLPCDVTRDQEQQLARRLHTRERALGLRHLAQLPVVALDRVRGVDQPSD